MADGWVEVKKQVTCSICLSVFREPKILPCLHTYCAKCLQTLWERADQVDDKKVLHCPTCREKILLNAVENLQLNFFVSNLVDTVELQDKLNKEAPPTCQSCDSKEDAVASCVPCGVFMCSSCLGVHKRLRITSTHQIIGLDDIKSGKVTVPSILDHRQEMCSLHPDKPLELYCKKEKSLICLGCAVVKHRDHQYDFISQIANEQKDEISDTLPVFRMQLTRVKQAASRVESMQEELQKRNMENIHVIEQTFQKILVALYERKQQLLDGVNKTTADRMKALNEQHEELLHLHAQMNSYLELVENKLKSERDRVIVAMKDQMINRGSSLLKVAHSTDKLPVETVPPKVEFPRLQNIIDLVKLLGTSFCNETCTLVEVTRDPSKPTFRVKVKDSSGQPVLNCSSLLDVRILPNSGSYDIQEALKMHNIQQPKIINKGNGCYEFFTTCNVTQPITHYRDYYGHVRQSISVAPQKYGIVSVQVFGKDVPQSPLK